MVERMNRILVNVITGNNRQVLEPRNVKPKHKIQKAVLLCYPHSIGVSVNHQTDALTCIKCPKRPKLFM